MDDTTRTNVPKYELLRIDENGDEIRRYENGVIRNQNGHILQLPDYLKEQQITSETAHIHHQMRKDKILRAIEAKVQDITRTNVPAEAVAAIVGKRAEIAMKDNGKTGNDAAKIVLQMMDAYQDKQETRTNVLRQVITMDDNTRQLLERIAEQMRDSTDVLVIDGDVDGIDN